MARIARVVVPGIPHHITQRGNNRQQVFFTTQDRLLYLRLLREYSERHKLSIWGYCLMPNHVHIIAVPHQETSLARALGRIHAEYARYTNIRTGASGHMWQARYYSCPMDATHTWSALAYVERNPVRAGLTERAAGYPWSSAAAHLGGADPFGALDDDAWRSCYTANSWRAVLSAPSPDQALDQRIRDANRSGRPLGDGGFIQSIESQLSRPLTPQRRGPRRHEPLAATA